MLSLITAAAFLAGGSALIYTGWRMELLSLPAAALADPTPADDQEGADDAVPAEDL